MKQKIGKLLLNIQKLVLITLLLGIFTFCISSCGRPPFSRSDEKSLGRKSSLGKNGNPKPGIAKDSRKKKKGLFDKDSPAKSAYTPSPLLTKKQNALLEGARSRLGDIYDASYYAKGHPPDGKSACVDVVYYAYKKIGIDLQEKVDADVRSQGRLYPNLGDRAINHRRCPNLIVWFRGFITSLTKKTDRKHLKQWQPGDVVFCLQNDGVADHVGIISDYKTDKGVPLVIHQFPPKCKEEDVLNRWVIMGHFRK